MTYKDLYVELSNIECSDTDSFEKYCPFECLNYGRNVKYPDWCPRYDIVGGECDREKCWNMELHDEYAMPKLRELYRSQEQPKLQDSGNRREFETGAVRDIHEGKGRCDLLPLDVVNEVLNHDNHIFYNISWFQATGEVLYLYNALNTFIGEHFEDVETAILEVAKHFEDGCQKYGENNWQKGIPAKCYIDSAVRHYLKFSRGDKDERHDRAFMWNIMCCIWTCRHKPELNDYAKKEEEN